MVKEQASKENKSWHVLTDTSITKILHNNVKTYCHTRCMRKKAVAMLQHRFLLCRIQGDIQPVCSHAVAEKQFSPTLIF